MVTLILRKFIALKFGKAMIVLCSVILLAINLNTTPAQAQSAAKTLAEETLFSCIASFAQSQNCNAANWANIQTRCNLSAVPNLQSSTILADGIQNNQCTSTNWASFSASVWADLYP